MGSLFTLAMMVCANAGTTVVTDVGGNVVRERAPTAAECQAVLLPPSRARVYLTNAAMEGSATTDYASIQR